MQYIRGYEIVFNMFNYTQTCIILMGSDKYMCMHLIANSR